MTPDEFLVHHGVRGMKWGHRKTGASAPSTKPRQSKPSSDFKTVQQLKGRHPSTLSNKQLKKLNERLNLEQNFNKLNPKAVEKGHAKVKSTLAIGTTMASAYALYNSPAGKALKQVFNRTPGKHFKK